MAANRGKLRRVLARLRERGVLLECDAALPSVAELVVSGEPPKGSWWTHPQAGEIFRVTRALAGHRDVLVTKLVLGKLSYVHRRLWSHLLAVACSGEAWQREGLSEDARALARHLARRGSVASDEYGRSRGSGKGVGPAIRELEVRLRCASEEVHTESGAHAKLLMTWSRWAEKVGFRPEPVSVRDAKETFESLHPGFSAPGALPWSSRSRGRRRRSR
jgi:hypothetical protein